MLIKTAEGVESLAFAPVSTAVERARPCSCRLAHWVAAVAAGDVIKVLFVEYSEYPKTSHRHKGRINPLKGRDTCKTNDNLLLKPKTTSML